jgi:hypothetical protein
LDRAAGHFDTDRHHYVAIINVDIANVDNPNVLGLVVVPNG